MTAFQKGEKNGWFALVSSQCCRHTTGLMCGRRLAPPSGPEQFDARIGMFRHVTRSAVQGSVRFDFPWLKSRTGCRLLT